MEIEYKISCSNFCLKMHLSYDENCDQLLNL